MSTRRARKGKRRKQDKKGIYTFRINGNELKLFLDRYVDEARATYEELLSRTPSLPSVQVLQTL